MATQVQKNIRPSVVLIQSDRGTGTGFVLDGDGNDVLLATNYHVVQGSGDFSAVFDEGAKLGNLDVVKVDIENDLALLKVPGLGRERALNIAPTGVVLGQEIGAMGYPYVAGQDEPSLTFEKGEVTNVTSKFDGRDFIITNANINPGNSGGPVVNGCGQVVGVVVAVHKETQRTALIVPSEKLARLQREYELPRDHADVEIRNRVKSFEKAVRFRRGMEVAGMFSSDLLRNRAPKVFMESVNAGLQRAKDKITLHLRERANQGNPVVVDGRALTDASALSEDLRGQLMAKILSEQEMAELKLLSLIVSDKIDEQTAMMTWMGVFAQEVFGDTPTFTVEAVRATSEKLARADLAVHSPAGQAFWEFNWVYEWGDWRLDTFKCLRNCK